MESAGPGFDDGKDPDALRTIGEVARTLKIRQHVLRYWEEQFPTLQPIKRSGGRRYYRPEDVRLIETINRLVHTEGYTLRGARQAIRQLAKATPAARATGIVDVPTDPATDRANGMSAQSLAKLSDIRRRLEAALDAA